MRFAKILVLGFILAATAAAQTSKYPLLAKVNVTADTVSVSTIDPATHAESLFTEWKGEPGPTPLGIHPARLHKGKLEISVGSKVFTVHSAKSFPESAFHCGASAEWGCGLPSHQGVGGQKLP